MKGLIDTHFHLDHYKNYQEQAKKINELEQYTICVTNSPGIFNSCKTIIPESQYLRHALGFHPQESGLNKNDLFDFMKLLDRTRYVGEIGLDFSKKSNNDFDFQIYSFEKIVERCSKENKIMTVHVRKAEREAYEILARFRPQKCIIHWYTGNEDYLYKFIELGCFFSVNTNMVQSINSAKYKLVPQNKILVESDGPYTKVSGKKFDPSLLLEAYEHIARFYEDKDFAKKVFNNFKIVLEL